jgi:hypothetical protein
MNAEILNFAMEILSIRMPFATKILLHILGHLYVEQMQHVEENALVHAILLKNGLLSHSVFKIQIQAYGHADPLSVNGRVG